MDTNSHMLNVNINELLKTSKQLQNKIRQELGKQNVCSTFSAEKSMPPIWDNTVSSPYVKSVVSDYLLSSETSNRKYVEPSIQMKQPAKPIVHSAKEVCTPKISRKGSLALTSSVETENQIDDAVPQVVQSVKEVRVPQKIAGLSKAVNTRPVLNKKANPLSASSKKCIETPSKTSIKPSISALSVLRLPLQRFAENTKGTNDFSQEHPTLELDMSSKQTTLFPRRFQRGSDNCPTEINTINLAEAETKPPAAVLREKQTQTWNEVFSKNQIKEIPQKALRLNKGISSSFKVVPPPQIENATKVIDIISTPANGLFHIEKETERLSKQKKCKLQRFPVMYIRPEYQVQQLPQISIQADNHINFAPISSNVQYLECAHAENQSEVNSLPTSEPDVPETPQFEEASGAVRNQENKYFKALGLPTNLPKRSSIVNGSSSSSTSGKLLSSSTSLLSSKSKQSNNSLSDTDIQYLIENILSSSDTQKKTTSKEFIKNPIPTQRREVYVQTDYASSTSTTTTPQKPPPREVYVQTDNKADAATSTEPMLMDTLNKHTPATSTLNEDDFISNIFNRIRNDIPNALQEFKNRTTTFQQEEEDCSSSRLKQNPDQTQHQMTTINDTSKAEIEPRLSCVEPKTDTVFETQCPLQSPPTIPSSSTPVAILTPKLSAVEDSRFLLLQQNPLFVQTINRIKSSAIHEAMKGDDGGSKDDRHIYPTDAEIKRAVKIFLDSLDGSGSSRGDGVGNRRKVTSCSTSTSSSIGTSCSSRSGAFRNKKTTNEFVLTRGLSRSSESTTSYSSSIVDTRTSVETQNSRSDGEVLSMGEV